MDESKESTLKSFQDKDYSVINFAAVGDIITEWNLTTGEFESSINKAVEDPTFQVLKNIELSNGIDEKFDKGILSIVDALKSTVDGTNQYFNDLMAKDEKLKGLLPEKPGGGQRNPKPNPEQEVVPNPEQEVVPDPVPEPEIPLQAFDTTKITSVDHQAIFDTIFGMSTDSKVRIDELLKTDEGKQQLLEALLNSNISDELKAEIQKSDLNSIADYVLSVLSKDGKLYNLDEVSNSIIKDFVEKMIDDRVARNVSLTAIEIRNDVIDTLKNVTEFLNESINSVSKTTGLSQLKPNLISVYDGNWEKPNLKKEDVTLIRTMLDFLGVKNEDSVENIISNDKYTEQITNAVKSLSSGSNFLNLLNKCSDEHFNSNSSDLFNSERITSYEETAELNLASMENLSNTLNNDEVFVPSEGFE